MNKLLFTYRRKKIQIISKKLDYYIQKTLSKHNVSVITITGTIGKTSTKVAISQLLSHKYTTFIETENNNSDRTIRLNFFGLEFPDHSRRLITWVPLLLRVRQLAKQFPYEVVVLEMAESRQKSLEQFIKSLKPNISVVTGISPAHMRYFKTLDRVVDATWSLAKLSDFIIYNADFSELSQLASGNSNTLSYGLENGSIKLTDISSSYDNTLVGDLSINNSHTKISTNFIATQSLYGVVAASAVAHKFGWTTDEIRKAVSKLKPVSGRMCPLPGIKNSLIIDDSFNASPLTVKAALETLSHLQGYKIAVLGSMNELGEESAKDHQRIGQIVAKSVDILITVGSEAKKYMTSAAVEAGMSKNKIYSFQKSNEVGPCLLRAIKPGSVILFKGSQGGIFIEEAIKFVMQNPGTAHDVLVRQKGEWLRRKKDYFSILN